MERREKEKKEKTEERGKENSTLLRCVNGGWLVTQLTNLKKSDISINSAGAASNTTPSKAYTCQYCAKSVKVLSRHIQDVHRDRLVNPPGLYPCLVDGCPRVEDAFKRRDNRTQHLRTVHGLDIEKQKPGRVGKSSPRSNLDDEQWPRPGEGWASEVEERRGGYGDAL